MEKCNLSYEKFLMYLRQFQNKAQKEFNEELKKFGISSTHIGIITILKNHPMGCSMSEISRIIMVDNALMTRNIKELEKINYVYRNRENESQRKYHICLTEEGNEVANEIERIIRQKQECFQQHFTKEEQMQVEQGIKILIEKSMKIMESEDKKC